MAEEYFIRGTGEETASGPYSLDALLTLGEAGKITKEHFYYDSPMESWVAIRANEVLCQKVFPERKRIGLRKKTAEEIHSINRDVSPEGAVRVQDMLAAAEGQTEETKYVRQQQLWQERAAALSVPVLAILLLVSAASVLYPGWAILNDILNDVEGAWLALFQKPILLVGLLDLLMGLFLLLNATEVFPLIRFRAMLGAGFFGVTYASAWINGDPNGLWMALAAVAFGIGIYTCTLTLNFMLMVAAATAGLVGAAGLIWYSNLVPLLMDR